MEIANGIIIPVLPDNVLSPDVHYSYETTGIYFQTADDQFGRITFYNLDAIKVYRGEYLPFPDNREEGEEFPWVYNVDNSKWLRERFEYEKEHYESSYEFSGNVQEMLTDFSHYIFKFHDQFVEVIAKGFWFEKDAESLFKKELQTGHPFLPLPVTNVQRLMVHTLPCQARINTNSIEELVWGAQYYPQKLIEFALELEGQASVSYTLVLSYKNGKLISSLRDYLGKQIAEFEGVATLEYVKLYIEKYMEEVYQRRKTMGK